MPSVTRRRFIAGSAAAAGFYILPSGLFSNPPNSRLCTAHIGVGGKGRVDLRNIAQDPRTQVVALCDVDRHRLNGEDAKRADGDEELLDPIFAKAPKFQDYREMFARMGDRIDAVSVSTPDHTHYPATLAAMEQGIHVYTQKPLTNNISEARHLRKVAREKGIVTQMGIQNKASTGYRLATELIRTGVIGKVARVHVWSHKDWGYDGEPYSGSDPEPDYLDWNLWLGSAPHRPFLKGKYHPGQWRRFYDFGSGTLGDMGIHIFDTPFDALRLQPPRWVVTECRACNGNSLPTSTIVRFGFPPSALTTGDFEWTWYDGGSTPPTGRDFELPDGQSLPEQGAMFVGENGRMLLGHIEGPRFLPRSIHESLHKPEIPRIVNHYGQWIDAIYGSPTVPAANFEYAAPLCESVLLGVVAGRFPGRKIHWDTSRGEVTNLTEANQFVAMRHPAI